MNLTTLTALLLALGVLSINANLSQMNEIQQLQETVREQQIRLETMEKTLLLVK